MTARALLGKSLVTGANGFLGSAMVDALLARRVPVRAALRRGDAAWAKASEKIVVGNLSKSTDWSAAVEGIDCIFHLAGRAHVLNDRSGDPLAEFRAVNRDATLGLAKAAEAASVRRMVFVSSIGVNGGQTHGKPFTTRDRVTPHSSYAIAKWEAEQQLLEFANDAGIEIVIVRPPLIVGRGAKGNLATLFKAIDRGVPLPLASVTNNRRDFVSLENLVLLLLTAAQHPDAPGQTFLASDGHPISTRELIEHLARLTGAKARLFPCPPALLEKLLYLLGRRQMASQLLGNLEIDISATCRALNWNPAPACRSGG